MSPVRALRRANKDDLLRAAASRTEARDPDGGAHGRGRGPLTRPNQPIAASLFAHDRHQTRPMAQTSEISELFRSLCKAVSLLMCLERVVARHPRRPRRPRLCVRPPARVLRPAAGRLRAAAAMCLDVATEPSSPPSGGGGGGGDFFDCNTASRRHPTQSSRSAATLLLAMHLSVDERARTRTQRARCARCNCLRSASSPSMGVAARHDRQSHAAPVVVVVGSAMGGSGSDGPGACLLHGRTIPALAKLSIGPRATGVSAARGSRPPPPTTDAIPRRHPARLRILPRRDSGRLDPYSPPRTPLATTATFAPDNDEPLLGDDSSAIHYPSGAGTGADEQQLLWHDPRAAHAVWDPPHAHRPIGPGRGRRGALARAGAASVSLAAFAAARFVRHPLLTTDRRPPIGRLRSSLPTEANGTRARNGDGWRSHSSGAGSGSESKNTYAWHVSMEIDGMRCSGRRAHCAWFVGRVECKCDPRGAPIG